MKGAETKYDEELTPAFDPPVIEPPPPATLLGRIFAHRRSRRTVVQAPLVRVDGPQTPTNADNTAPAEVSREEVVAVEEAVDEPVDAVVEEVVVPAPEVTAEQATEPVVEEAPEPVVGDVAAEEEAPEAPPGEPPPVEVATRYCARCGDRVPLAADGLHCHLGHRLSPAHGKRRWWRRQR